MSKGSNYYITPGIDEQKVLDSARDDTAGDNYREALPESTIHYHSSNDACRDQRHRLFTNGQEVK